MNTKALYREIGNIDDDLIAAANDAGRRKSKVKVLYSISAVAACLCLLLGGILFAVSIPYFNELPTPPSAKVVPPAVDGVQAVSLSYEELLAHYDLRLPDILSERLTRSDISGFVLYIDKNGNVAADTNTLYYSSADGNMSLTLTLSTGGALSETARPSVVDGVPVMLAFSESDSSYWAELEANGTFFRIISGGLSKSEFTDAIEEIIEYVK